MKNELPTFFIQPKNRLPWSSIGEIKNVFANGWKNLSEIRVNDFVEAKKHGKSIYWWLNI